MFVPLLWNAGTVITVISTSPFLLQIFIRYYVDGPRKYGNFVELSSKLLSDRGVFVAQIGAAPFLDSPAAENSVLQNRYKFVQSLLGSVFKSVVDYEEVSFLSAFPYILISFAGRV